MPNSTADIIRAAALAEGFDDARNLHPQDGRRARGRRIHALGLADIGVIETRGHDLDHDFARAGARLLGVA